MMKLNKHWNAYSSLLLSASGLLLISIAGCGGGGGGSNARTAPVVGPTNIPSVDPPPVPAPTVAPTPGPTPDLGPTGACPIDPTTYPPNYAAALLAGYTTTFGGVTNTQPPGKLGRHAGYPLKIYFNDNGNATADRKAYAQQGFSQWVTGTQNRVQLTITTNKAEADVVVTFSPYDGNGILGVATTADDPATNILFEFFQDTRNVADNQKAGHLQLNYTGNARTDLTTAAHEFGHILGIRGHSPDALDQMFYADNPNNSGLTTTPDINTLRVAHCDNFTPLAKMLQRRSKTTRNTPFRIIVIQDTYKSLGLDVPKK